MGLAVTIFATHGRPVRPLVTGDTIKLPVLGRGSGQHRVHFAVAGGAMDRRQPVGEIHLRRRMGRMTNQTVGVGHFRAVRGVTFDAGLLATMGGMTEGAIDLQVLARPRQHRLIDIAVTADTGGAGLLRLTEIEF